MAKVSFTLDHGPLGGNYSPGSALTGSVTVEVDSPKEFKAVLVYVRGEGHVEWTERRHNSSDDSDYTVVFKSDEVYVSLQQTLWKCEDSPDGVFPVGRHTYPFHIVLPVTCPSSFTSETGSIFYQIDGRVATGVPNLVYRASQFFSVLELVTFPPGVGEQPVHVEIRKKVRSGLFKSGEVVFKADLPKTRICAGEQISMSYCIENGSSKDITPSFSVVEDISYFAEGSTKLNSTVFAVQGSTAIPPHSAREGASFSISLPPCRPAMTRSNIIKSSISLVTTLIIPGAFTSNMVVPVVLYISNVKGLPQQQIPQQPQQQQQVEQEKQEKF